MKCRAFCFVVFASTVAVMGVPAAPVEGGVFDRARHLRSRLATEYADVFFHNRAEVKPRHVPPLTPYEDLKRAGKPYRVAPWAHCTYDQNYSAYYVGGGAALSHDEPTHFRGERRYPDEGTFGVDYDPWYSRVRLQWFHGRRSQGGEGQYEPDRHNFPFRRP